MSIEKKTLEKVDVFYDDKKWGKRIDPDEWNANFKVLEDGHNKLVDSLTEQFSDIDAAIEAVIEERGGDIKLQYRDNIETLNTAVGHIVSDIDNRYTKLQSDTLLAEGTNSLIKDVSYESNTGVFTITKKDGSKVVIDTVIEKVPASMSLKEETDGSVWLVVTNQDGSVTKTNVTSLIEDTVIADSDTVVVFSSTDAVNRITTYTLNIKPNSLGLNHFDSELVTKFEETQAAKTAAVEAKNSAESYASQAKQSAQSAESFAESSGSYATNASNSAKSAKSSEIIASNAVEGFKSVVNAEAEIFDTNAKTKFSEFNDIAKRSLTEYNGNATEKLDAYNSNANNKVAEFDSHTEQIQTDISGLKNDLINYDDGIKDYINEYLKDKMIFVQNSVIGTPVNIEPVKSTGGMSCIVIDAKEGDEFELKIKANGNHRAYAFLDSENKVLLASNGTLDGNNFYDNPISIIAPKNTVKLISNNYYSLEDCYLRKSTKINDRISLLERTVENIKYDAMSHKIVLPRWAEVHPFKDYNGIYTYTQDMNNAGFGFNNWYQMFHSLITDYTDVGLIETDIGSLYNSAKSETTPSYITNVTNGKMVMYHMTPPASDESGFEIKHKKLKVVLVSGVHGSERKSIFDNYILLKQLCDCTFASVGEQLPQRAFLNIRNFVDLYVVPLVNISGIDTGSRNNYNSINLNRDFNVDNWQAVSGSSNAPNSQWETRVISYILNEIKPDVVIDHHTSSGDNRKYDENPDGIELGKFIQWGDSDIPVIESIIEENLMEITPYVKYAFPEKLGDTNFVFGHTEDITTLNNRVGTLPRYAYQNGAISLTYEVVQHLRWTPLGTDRLFGFSDTDEIQLASINYFGYINMIMKVFDVAKEWINGNVDYKYK